MTPRDRFCREITRRRRFAVFALRDSCYAEAADVTIDVNGKSFEQILDEIEQYVNGAG